MYSLKFHPGPPFPTLLRPAGGPPPKRPYSYFSGGLPRRAGGLPPSSILLNTQRHTAKLFQFKGVMDLPTQVVVVVVVVVAGRDIPGLYMAIWHYRVREGLPL
jgi:hypothetical protein